MFVQGKDTTLGRRVQTLICMVSDRYPRNAVETGFGDTSLLDTEYKPKPAYYEVLKALKQA